MVFDVLFDVYILYVNVWQVDLSGFRVICFKSSTLQSLLEVCSYLPTL